MPSVAHIATTPLIPIVHSITGSWPCLNLSYPHATLETTNNSTCRPTCLWASWIYWPFSRCMVAQPVEIEVGTSIWLPWQQSNGPYSYSNPSIKFIKLRDQFMLHYLMRIINEDGRFVLTQQLILSVFRRQKYLICNSVCKTCFTIVFWVTDFSDADHPSANVFPRTAVGKLCGLSITDAWRCMPVQIAWAISRSKNKVKPRQ